MATLPMPSARRAGRSSTSLAEAMRPPASRSHFPPESSDRSASGYPTVVSIPQRVVGCLAALSIVAAFGCGDDGTRVDVEPPATPPGSGIQIRGTERLAWDQPAPSYQRVLQYAFTLFIDGNAASLAGVECLDSSSGGGYPCAARLPQMSNGTHTIQIAAVVDGMESPRSSSLTVSMNQGRVAVTPEIGVSTADSAGALEPATICLESGFPCVGVRRELSRAVPLSSPAALPDGRLLFVEDGRHVRMLVDGVVVSEPALTVSAGDARTVALLVDPAFERTRVVRVAGVEESARSGRTLVITRFRELNNRLSDPAVVVAGVPLPSTGEPRVVQDTSGRIYVAVPTGVEGNGRRGPDEGDVLRFSPDGLTFSANLGPPTFARGYDEPLALTIHTRDARLWLSGNDRGRIEGLRSIPLMDPTETVTASPSRRESVAEVATARAIVGLAAVMQTESPADTHFLAVDTDGALLWARAEAGGLASMRLPLDGERALSLSGQPDGTILLTTSSTGDAPSFSVFRLYPQTAR
jgi:hypothetical protein